MTQFIQLTIATAATFVAIDAIWLGIIAKKLYRDILGNLLRTDPLMPAAAIFYVIFIVGLVFFVIQPAIDRSSWLYALGAGALFGLVTYATYDLTNLATLKDWPLKITILDLLWGSFISATVAVITYHVGKWLA
jgi:uncharacterized membrane protein